MDLSFSVSGILPIMTICVVSGKLKLNKEDNTVKIIGLFMMVVAFIILFVPMGLSAGWFESIKIWAAAIAFTIWVVVGVYFITGG